uniref:Uncharacterized protein n=1 Tax=Sipha flava TaxID=143950 RepID=A0A2S2Q3J0_9HEMI
MHSTLISRDVLATLVSSVMKLLASSINNILMSNPPICLYTDLIPLHRQPTHKSWKLERENLSGSYASEYKKVSSEIYGRSWVFNISRSFIVLCFRFRLWHNLLTNHALQL